ncbi:hypothetical protein ABTJ99_21985, partial [Acinetobacter baumannii]
LVPGEIDLPVTGNAPDCRKKKLPGSIEGTKQWLWVVRRHFFILGPAYIVVGFVYQLAED